ncbi:MAG: alpha/beta fold hydrolase [Anaerolineae bacterium]
MPRTSSGDEAGKGDQDNCIGYGECSPKLEKRFLQTGTIRLHVVAAGPEDGPTLVLLHGFPEFWYGWRHQIPALAEAGYRVVVPDQRGYNLSDKPKGIQAYAADLLVHDVVNLVAATGQEKIVLVGHDWGAMVAWWVAERYPETIAKLVVINVPHPAVMRHHLRPGQNPRQLLRSWYTGFFQLPRLPETLLRLGNWTLMTRALQRSSLPGTFSADDLVRYRKAWSQPGAITAMINWYRAAYRRNTDAPRTESNAITVPTLLIWGAQDPFLGEEMAHPSIRRCEDGRLELIQTATHWIHHEKPDLANSLISHFLLH